MLLLWTLFLSVLSYSVAQSCYYPNGDLSTSDAPCSDGSGQASCCSSSYYCLSNHLCQYQDGRLYRGSCTDEAWNSGNCPQFCQDNNPGNGIQVFQCSIDLNTYCCSTNNSDPNSCCSKADVELFTLAAASTLGQIVSTTFSNFQTSSTSSPTTSSSSTSTSSISTSSSSTATGSTSSGTTGSSPTTASRTASDTSSSTGTGTAAGSSSTGSADSGGGGGSNAGAIAGGAVGGVAVLGAIALGAWWLFVRKRKDKSGAAAGVPASPNDNKEHYQYYGSPQGGYYQSAPQDEPREMDGGQTMIPHEMDSTPQRQQPNAWHELPADSVSRR